MTTLDWIFAVFFALAWLNGFWRGLVRELMALAAWVVGFVLAPRFAPLLASLLPMPGASASVKYLVGFILVLLITVVVLGVAARLLHELVDWVGLGLVDRFLGGVFSIAKTTIICLCLTIMVNLTALKTLPLWRESVGVQWLVQLLVDLKPLLPPEYGKYVN